MTVNDNLNHFSSAFVESAKSCFDYSREGVLRKLEGFCDTE